MTHEYINWLSDQTPERREASLDMLCAARQLGQASDKAPFSEEVKLLRKTVSDYYEEWGN